MAQAFPDKGSAYPRGSVENMLGGPAFAPDWTHGLKRLQGVTSQSDPNMQTKAPDVGSAPAEWDFPTATTRTAQDT